MQTIVSAEGELQSEINTTPLIDVMLVLLVMLIVTLPPMRHVIDMDNPHPDFIQPPSDPLIVRIEVDYNGALLWNGARISAAEADRRLAAEALRAPQPEVHIEPHPNARYSVVAHLMAVAQREGIVKLGVRGGT